MVVSSVSPERCEQTAVQPARVAISMASSVSVSVPIWLSLMRMELAEPFSMPWARRSTLVTKRSSPTIWMRSPSLSVMSFQPSQSSSARPSSMLMIGYLSTSAGVVVDHLGRGAASRPSSGRM